MLAAKVFDFLNKSKQMMSLSTMLYQSRKAAFHFLLLFATLLLGFTGLCYLSFGSYLPGYSTFSSALATCFQTILGHFDYE